MLCHADDEAITSLVQEVLGEGDLAPLVRHTSSGTSEDERRLVRDALRVLAELDLELLVDIILATVRPRPLEGIRHRPAA